MERATAIKTLSKLLGKEFRYQINNVAPTPDERAVAKLELADAVAEKDRMTKKMEERYRTILQADDEYQTLREAVKRTRKVVDRLNGIVHTHKFTVGHANSLFFHVKAQGDTWEEVISKVKEEKHG